MLFIHIDFTRVVKILPEVRQGFLFYVVNILSADVLVTQGAKASTTVIFMIYLVETVKFRPRTLGVNYKNLANPYMLKYTRSSLIEIMDCRLIYATPLSEPMLHFCQLKPY